MKFIPLHSHHLKIFFTLCALFFGSFETALANPLIVAGSSTMMISLIEPTFTKLTENLHTQIQLVSIGSTSGLQMLINGQADVAALSTPLTNVTLPHPLSPPLEEHPVGVDHLVIIVHPENSVTKLTDSQLKDIYTGKIANWQEVGGANQPITIVTSHPGSGTRLVVQKEIMDHADYPKNTINTDSTVTELGLVSKLTGGIGAVSESFLKLYPDRVRPLETRKIVRPFLLITRGKMKETVWKFIQYFQKKNTLSLEVEPLFHHDRKIIVYSCFNNFHGWRLKCRS
ncbi:MAG: substrate-binding domain-containing protein [Magnetococcus sp. DMHC-6]